MEKVKDATGGLRDLLRCNICANALHDAHLCPHCTKMACHDCFCRWLESEQRCPFCRRVLDVGDLVNGRIINDISQEVEKLEISCSEGEAQCELHNLPLRYFCATCSLCICSDCGMFGDHHGHEVKRIDDMYKANLERVLGETERLKARVNALSTARGILQQNMDRLESSKRKKSDDIRSCVMHMEQNLMRQYETKRRILAAHQDTIASELELIESMLREIDRHVRKCPKATFIAKTEEMVGMLSEVNEKHGITDSTGSKEVDDIVSTEFSSEVVPEYFSSTFEVKDYAQYIEDPEKVHVCYSDYTICDGNSWRLKVYPNGNAGTTRNVYLSIFLELSAGVSTPTRYEYRFELVNHTHSDLSVVREYSSEFEVGECWGYNRFVRIESVLADGFLSPEDGHITIRFYVRAPTFYQKSQDQQKYIERLVKENKALLSEELKQCDTSQDDSSESEGTVGLESDTEMGDVDEVELVEVGVIEIQEGVEAVDNDESSERGDEVNSVEVVEHDEEKETVPKGDSSDEICHQEETEDEAMKTV